MWFRCEAQRMNHVATSPISSCTEGNYMENNSITYILIHYFVTVQSGTIDISDLSAVSEEKMRSEENRKWS